MPENDDDDHRIRVFLLDDHEIVRRGVRDLLEDSGLIQVVGEAGTAAEALARIPPTRPHRRDEVTLRPTFVHPRTDEWAAPGGPWDQPPLDELLGPHEGVATLAALWSAGHATIGLGRSALAMEREAQPTR